MNRHHSSVLLAVAVFLLLLSGLAGTCLASKRVALVIGNGAYQAAPLKNPVNDARDMTAALQQLDFEVITALNASKREMITSIDRFAAKLRRSEIGLFYYAGHGMQINGRNYLIPVKVAVQSESDVEFESVDAGRVLGKMKHAGNKLNVVVLDACRNNPFARSFRSGEQGLARMDAPVGTIIAYATGPGAVAADGRGRNGIFTKHLLTTIHTPDLSIQEIFNEAGMGVMRDTGNKQVPWTSNTPIPRYYLAGGSFVVETPEKKGSLRKKTKKEAVGSIRVKSTPPGATLYIDDQDSGTTPVTLSGLSAESTNIRVELAGYTPEEKQVQIRSGSRSTVSFVLSPLSRTGWLTVNPEPVEAKVRILNIAPRYMPGMELEPGRYQVEVSATGYERVVRWVKMAAGESIDVDIVLERISGPVHGLSYTDPTTGMEFVWVEGGCFQMGQTLVEKQQIIKERGREKYQKYSGDELPRHEVCVDGLYMGKHEVTVGQWRQFIRDANYTTDAEKDVKKDGCYSVKNGKWDWQDGADWENPGFSQQSSQPVVCVSHNDVSAFIRWLNRESSINYRLPTEAEWEYSARGNTTTVRYWGDGVDSKACSYANVDDKNWSGAFPCDDGYKYTAPVGMFRANGFGLYDMLGNVWEWTGDWYGEKYYSQSLRSNPTGPSSGVYRVLRGGGWSGDAANVRAAYRDRDRPWYRGASMGFRLVLPPRTVE